MSVFESQTEHELKPILARCKVQSVRVVYVGHLLNECAECTLESQHEYAFDSDLGPRSEAWLICLYIVWSSFQSLFKPCGTHNPNDPITVTPYWA